MRFELTDDFDSNLLLASGAACAVIGASALAAPRQAHELLMSSDAMPTATSDAWARCFGLALACNGTKELVIGVSDADKDAKRDMLKTAGAGWLAFSALSLFHGQEKVLKKESTVGMAAGQALMGALCLYRGFKGDGEEL